MPHLISGSKEVHAASSFLLLCVLTMPTLWLALCLFGSHPSRAPAVALELSIVLGFLCICQKSCCRFAAALLPLLWREICSLGLSVGATSNNWTCTCALNRCNTLSVKSRLQSKGIRWLVTLSGCLMICCLRGFCLVKSRGSIHLTVLGLVSMLLHDVTVKTVMCAGLTGMHKTGCSGQTRHALHMPSSA